MSSNHLHDDVIIWKHFRRYWLFVKGIHRSSVDSPYKGQWRIALMFSLICAWTNGWGNSWDAGDLRRHRVHCNVTVMWPIRWRHSKWSRNADGNTDCIYRIFPNQYRYFVLQYQPRHLNEHGRGIPNQLFTTSDLITIVNSVVYCDAIWCHRNSRMYSFGYCLSPGMSCPFRSENCIKSLNIRINETHMEITHLK